MAGNVFFSAYRLGQMIHKVRGGISLVGRVNVE